MLIPEMVLKAATRGFTVTGYEHNDTAELEAQGYTTLLFKLEVGDRETLGFQEFSLVFWAKKLKNGKVSFRFWEASDYGLLSGYRRTKSKKEAGWWLHLATVTERSNA